MEWLRAGQRQWVRIKGQGSEGQESGGHLVNVRLLEAPLPLRCHPVAAYHSDQLSEHTFKLLAPKSLRRGHKNATPEKAAISAVGRKSPEPRAESREPGGQWVTRPLLGTWVGG